MNGTNAEEPTLNVRMFLKANEPVVGKQRTT